MIKVGDTVIVKKGVHSACDGMTGKVVAINGDYAMVKFGEGDIVDLFLSYLIKSS